MTRLILFRHAKAERRAESGEDFDRILTDRGRNDAVLMGEALRGLGMTPDLALVSAAARTTGTWAAMAPAFQMARVEIRAELYDADAETRTALAEIDRIAALRLADVLAGARAIASTAGAS